MNQEILSQAANEARGLAIDAVHASSSGHLGLPLGCAEIGAVLFGGGYVLVALLEPWAVARYGWLTAAQFLGRFVQEGVPWVHLDIAGVASVKEDTPYAPKGASGLAKSCTSPLRSLTW